MPLSELQRDIVIAVAALAAVIDFRTGQIPNWLTLSAIAAALAAGLLRGVGLGGEPGWGPFTLSVFGLIVCSSVPLLMWRLSGMGGGDVKLLAGVGALLGPVVGLRAEIYALFTLLAYVLALLVYRGRLLITLGRSLLLLVRPFQARRARLPSELMAPVRFGPAIFVGTLLASLGR